MNAYRQPRSASGLNQQVTGLRILTERQWAYRSEQPVHPDRDFAGREQVRQNWAAVFDGVPNFRAELLRSAEAGDARWAEWYWHGTRADGTRLEMRGVTIFGIQHDRILCGQLYMEDVDRSGGNIDQAVRRMTMTAE